MRLRKPRRPVAVDDELIYPGFSEDRYVIIRRVSASGTYAMWETRNEAYCAWAPVGTFRERWGSE